MRGFFFACNISNNWNRREMAAQKQYQKNFTTEDTGFYFVNCAAGAFNKVKLCGEVFFYNYCLVTFGLFK